MPKDSTRAAISSPHVGLQWAAFAAVYIIWGSTYLGIRFAIETIPPFTMAGLRFLAAGAVLFGWARVKRKARPSLLHWRTALVVGGLLMGSNGMLSWAEQFVPSGTAALIIATVPLWMVIVEALRRGGERPTISVVAGLVVGLIGIAILVEPGRVAGDPVDPVGAVVLLLAALGWAVGSVYSRGAPSTDSTAQNVGMQMLLGGILLLALGFGFGERFDPGGVSGRSFLALAYLTSAGGIVTYAAYIWLLKVSTPAKVSTYAYVNPVVAVLLGAWLAEEILSPRVVLAGIAVVLAVALITRARQPRAEEDP